MTEICLIVLILSMITSVTIAESEVLFAIDRLKNNFSCPDDLPPVLFKKLKEIFVIPLTVLFNHCYCLLLLYPRTGEMLSLYLCLKRLCRMCN